MDSLAGYASSDEDNPSTPPPLKRKFATAETETKAIVDEPSSKRRKLPPLSSSFQTPAPESDLSKHQGRIRTHPHVEGQFASYVYVPVTLDVGTPLSKLVERVFRHARNIVPIINPISTTAKENDQEKLPKELHISLTRPIYLRHHQRETLRNAVRLVARNNNSFSPSFATFTTFKNDEKTRAFLALEVGAGHSELSQLVEALTPTLRSLYQQEYYSEPRFHASIAWVLLKTSLPCLPAGHEPESLSDTDIGIQQELSSDSTNRFPVVSDFPSNLVQNLIEKAGTQLLQRGVFDVSQIKVKIGNDVRGYSLGT